MNNPWFIGGIVGMILVVAVPTLKTGWKKGKQVLKAVVIGAVCSGAALWLLSMVVLQVITRTEPNADFQKSMEVTSEYIQGGILLFSVLGGVAGGLFMNLWYEDEEAEGGSRRRKKKKKSPEKNKEPGEANGD